MASTKMKFGFIFGDRPNVIHVLHVDYQRDTELDEYRMHVGVRWVSLVWGQRSRTIAHFSPFVNSRQNGDPRVSPLLVCQSSSSRPAATSIRRPTSSLALGLIGTYKKTFRTVDHRPSEGHDFAKSHLGGGLDEGDGR